MSVDAYQYFGTADLYLGYVTSFLRNGGQIGVVVPAVLEEVGADIPPHLEPYWESEFCCFHSPDWWRTHWAKTGKVRVDSAAAIEDGWKDWLRFDETTGPLLDGWRKDSAARGVAMHKADQGKLLGFTRIVATKVRSPRFRDEGS